MQTHIGRLSEDRLPHQWAIVQGSELLDNFMDFIAVSLNFCMFYICI